MSIPSIIFALLLLSIFGTSIMTLVIVIGIIYSPRVFRLARAVAGNIVVMDYIEAAKLRACRRLWSRAADACGVTEADRAAPVHAVAGSRGLATRDPWVNMLRTTVGSVATDDLATMLQVNVCEPLGERFRFLYRMNWLDGRHIDRDRQQLAATRPTAVNLFWALDRCGALARRLVAAGRCTWWTSRGGFCGRPGELLSC